MPEAVKEKEKIEVAAGGAPAANPEKKPSGFLKLLIAFGVMQIILATGAFFLVKIAIIPKLGSGAKTQEEAKAESKESAAQGEIFLIENIIVNPAGTNGTRYLSTSIGFEVEKSEKVLQHFKEMIPIIRDILIAILSSKTLDELSSTAGKEAIRKEILEKMNLASAPDSVSKVYFVDYVLQ